MNKIIPAIPGTPRPYPSRAECPFGQEQSFERAECDAETVRQKATAAIMDLRLVSIWTWPIDNLTPSLILAALDHAGLELRMKEKV